ncbi:MAG: translation elongation factor Ts [Christensenellaceae bacterium]|jgi:elongation factor Ts|nr:translation elongation factor Ts [Christensenellaceae bacterium]
MADITVTASAVKELRERSGAGMMDCKKALVECGGDIERASDYLREKGLAKAVKKSGRIAAEGIVDSYIHMGGKIGVMLEVNCETDFVARTDEFKELVHDIALHIAASNPMFVREEDVDPQVVAKEREIQIAAAKEENSKAAKPKPDAILEKMVDGRMNKFLKDICLLDQPFVKNPDQTVGDLVKEKVAKIGENIQVRRFVRWEMGEGLTKRVNDLAAEVAEQIAKN